MKFAKLLIFFAAFSSAIFSQNSDRIKISGGFVIPSVSTKGFTTNIEYERQMNERLSLYFYSGIYTWDRNQLTYPGKGGFINGYNEDSHLLIPVYGGMKIMISKIATFTVFGDFELGYNFMTYNTYKTNFIYDESGHQLVALHADLSHPQNKDLGLFGFGIGLGVTQSINENFSLLVEIKRNSLIKSSENWLTHYYLNAGVVLGI